MGCGLELGWFVEYVYMLHVAYCVNSSVILY
jgi:hypothetical protein